VKYFTSVFFEEIYIYLPGSRLPLWTVLNQNAILAAVDRMKLPGKSWIVIKLLVILLVGVVVLRLMFRMFERSQIYQPTRAFWAQAGDLGVPWEDVFFHSEDGIKLHGWYFRSMDATRGNQRAVLICHGNGGNIGHRLDLCSVYLELGLDVFVFDYRGYGKSGGRPSEEGTYLDAQAAHQWMQTTGRFKPDRIIAHGESLGGAVVVELARRAGLAGIILQSTFTSIPDIGAEIFPWLPVRRIASFHYDTRTKLPAIKIPVLFLHSRTDRLIVFKHAERNFAVANEPANIMSSPWRTVPDS